MSESTFPPVLLKLIERLEGEETLELEYKAAQGSLPNSIWETVSAFANTNGGWIILGVAEDDTGTPVIKGVSDAAAQLKVFCDNLRNPQRISYPASGANDTAIENIDGKHLIIIRVRAAPLRERPVYVKGNPYAGTYVRRHSGDYLTNKQEVDRMMREASYIAADSAILPKFGLVDLDPGSLARYRQIFRAANPAHPWNSYDDLRFLEALGGYRQDRNAGIAGLTVAGLLMLGISESIRERRARHLIDYRLLSGDPDDNTRWDDRVTWEGNLLGAFETIYPRLTDGLPRPFLLEGGRRIDDSPVHVALREALVNLLIHADYAETQASLITRSPRAYHFRNPGGSRVSEIDLLAGDRSDPRNPSLVRMFRMVGLAEEAGTGIAKIRTAWRELGYRVPAISADTERYEFALNLSYIHLLSDDDREWLARFGETWSEAERFSLIVARHEGEVDNLKVRRLTGQHATDVTKVLGGLRDRGFLQMIGGGRRARYELTPMALTELSRASGADTGQLQLNLEGKSTANLKDKTGSSTDSEQSLQDKEPIPQDKASEVSPEVTRRDLLVIAQPARDRKRLPPSDLAQIIVQLCGRSPLGIRELAELLQRTETHLRDITHSLVEEDHLAYMYPERPSHPSQKYVASHASRDQT